MTCISTDPKGQEITDLAAAVHHLAYFADNVRHNIKRWSYNDPAPGLVKLELTLEDAEALAWTLPVLRDKAKRLDDLISGVE